MAIVLEANYAKKLGLPNFSSHQYSVTIRTELTDLTQVEEASKHLYGILQDAVDREIKAVGFMPDASTYGMKPSQNGNGSNGHQPNGNGHGPQRNNDQWNCTDGQKGLILRVVSENKLEKSDVEQMAQELFGIGVRELDKMQASQLIEDLLEKTGKKSNGRRRWSRQPAQS
jgi:hypothetical protein